MCFLNHKRDLQNLTPCNRLGELLVIFFRRASASVAAQVSAFVSVLSALSRPLRGQPSALRRPRAARARADASAGRPAQATGCVSLPRISKTNTTPSQIFTIFSPAVQFRRRGALLACSRRACRRASWSCISRPPLFSFLFSVLVRHGCRTACHSS